MRLIRSSSCLERSGLVIIVIGILIGLIFAIYGVIQDDVTTSDSCYSTILIVNCCFALVYVVKGIENEDPYDLVIVLLSVAPPYAYILINFIVGEKTGPKTVRLIFGSIFAVVTASLGFLFIKTYATSETFLQRYGLSSEPDSTQSQDMMDEMIRRKRLLRTTRLFFLLLNVNLQIDFSVAVFALMSGYAVDIKYLTINNTGMVVVFCFVVAFAFLGWMFGHLIVKHEKKWFIIVFWATSGFLVVAGIYLLIEAAIDLHKNSSDRTVIKVALTTSVFMIFVRLITCLGSTRIYKNIWKEHRETANRSSAYEQKNLMPSSLDAESSIQYGQYHPLQVNMENSVC